MSNTSSYIRIGYPGKVARNVWPAFLAPGRARDDYRERSSALGPLQRKTFRRTRMRSQFAAFSLRGVGDGGIVWGGWADTGHFVEGISQRKACSPGSPEPRRFYPGNGRRKAVTESLMFLSMTEPFKATTPLRPFQCPIPAPIESSAKRAIESELIGTRAGRSPFPGERTGV